MTSFPRSAWEREPQRSALISCERLDTTRSVKTYVPTRSVGTRGATQSVEARHRFLNRTKLQFMLRYLIKSAMPC